MGKWTSVGIDLGVGAAGGVVDQLIQNSDEKRGIDMAVTDPTKLDANGKLPIMKQYGTYYNYGVPIVGVLGVAFNLVRGEWATRLLTIGGQLAGRKVTHQLTTKATSSTPSRGDYGAWRQSEAEAKRRLAEAKHYDITNAQEILT